MSPWLNGTRFWSWLRNSIGARKRISLGTTDRKTAERIERVLDTLREQHQWSVLDALYEGRVSVERIVAHFDAGKVPQLVAALRTAESQPHDPDMEPLVALWLSSLERRGKPNLRGRLRYRDLVRGLIPEGVPYPRSLFTPAAISDYLDAQGKAGNHIATALSSFSRYAVLRGVLDVNPVGAVPKVAARPPRTVELTETQAWGILDRMEGAVRAANILAYATGMERSALQRARVSDLDVSTWTIRARGTKTHTRDRLCKVVGVRAQSELRSYLRGLGAIGDGMLLPIAGDWMSRGVVKAGKAAGVVMWLHGWRHVWAIQRLRDGWSYQAVAQQLGHADTAMVIRVYGKYRLADAEVRRLEDSHSTGEKVNNG